MLHSLTKPQLQAKARVAGLVPNDSGARLANSACCRVVTVYSVEELNENVRLPHLATFKPPIVRLHDIPGLHSCQGHGDGLDITAFDEHCHVGPGCVSVPTQPSQRNPTQTPHVGPG